MDRDLDTGVTSIAWNVYLAVAVIVGQYYFVSSVTSEPDSTIYTAVSASGAVAVVVGLLLNRPTHKIGWVLVAGALACYVAGDLVLASLQESSVFVEFPSTADAFYLAMYPLLAAGLLLVARSIAPGRRRLATVDALLVGLSSLLVLGVVYMNAFFTDPFLDGSARWVAIAYPALDALLVAVVVRSLFLARPIPATFWLAAVGVASLVVGNAIYNVQMADFSFESGGLADLGWLAFTTFVGAAALHPSMGARVASSPAGESAPQTSAAPARLIGVVFVAVIGVAVYLVWGDGEGRPVAIGSVLASGALFVARSRVRGPRPRGMAESESVSDLDDAVEREAELVSA